MANVITADVARFDGTGLLGWRFIEGGFCRGGGGEGCVCEDRGMLGIGMVRCEGY